MKKHIVILALTSPLLVAKPVKVDDILTEKQSFRLDSSIGYANIQKQQDGSAQVVYQTQNGDSVTVPTYLGTQASNQDYVNYGLNLRYGISDALEVYSALYFYTSDTHISSADTFTTQNESGFNSLVIGATYEVKKEDETPALLLGISTDALKRSTFSDRSSANTTLKGLTLTATSYYTVDPVVFLLKTAYAMNLKEEKETLSQENGDLFSLTPQLYFAVNPYTSINWGVKYTYQDKGHIDDKVVSSGGSNVGYLLGASYEINAKTTVNMDVEYGSYAQYSQNNITVGLSYKF